MPKRRASRISNTKEEFGSKLSIVDRSLHANGSHGTTNNDNGCNDHIIDEANELSAGKFNNLYIDDGILGSYLISTTHHNESFQIEFKLSKDVTKPEIDACFKLIQSSSRVDYETSSWGWHPTRKRREMKDNDMRYLLVTAPKTLSLAGGVQGFLSFMLTHDCVPTVPVLYIYEIHLDQSLRRLGLGAHLMEAVESIAEKVGVEKVMLTCFLSNERAVQFYKRRGYATDECSPEDRKTRNKVVKADHMIMSKSVARPMANG